MSVKILKKITIFLGFIFVGYFIFIIILSFIDSSNNNMEFRITPKKVLTGVVLDNKISSIPSNSRFIVPFLNKQKVAVFKPKQDLLDNDRIISTATGAVVGGLLFKGVGLAVGGLTGWLVGTKDISSVYDIKIMYKNKKYLIPLKYKLKIGTPIYFTIYKNKILSVLDGTVKDINKELLENKRINSIIRN